MEEYGDSRTWFGAKCKFGIYIWQNVVRIAAIAGSSYNIIAPWRSLISRPFLHLDSSGIYPSATRNRLSGWWVSCGSSLSGQNYVDDEYFRLEYARILVRVNKPKNLTCLSCLHQYLPRSNGVSFEGIFLDHKGTLSTSFSPRQG